MRHAGFLIKSSRGGAVVLALLVFALADPSVIQNVFTNTGNSGAARHHHTATLLLNGGVLVVGGEDGAGNILSSAELYDPATRTWKETGSLAEPRKNHTAGLLPDGRVIVVGGYHRGELASAELFDPATGTWSGAGPCSRGWVEQLGRGQLATVIPSDHDHPSIGQKPGRVVFARLRQTSGFLPGPRGRVIEFRRGEDVAGAVLSSHHQHPAVQKQGGRVVVAGRAGVAGIREDVLDDGGIGEREDQQREDHGPAARRFDQEPCVPHGSTAATP